MNGVVSQDVFEYLKQSDQLDLMGNIILYPQVYFLFLLSFYFLNSSIDVYVSMFYHIFSQV